MIKTVLVALTLLFFVGCGEKNIKPSSEVKNETNSTVIKSEVTTPRPVATTVEATVVPTTDFVPAHIANSTIEVVPH